MSFEKSRSRAALGLGEQSNSLHAQVPAAQGYSSRANSMAREAELQEPRPVALAAIANTMSLLTPKGETTANFCFSPFSKVAEAPTINAKSCEIRTKVG